MKSLALLFSVIMTWGLSANAATTTTTYFVKAVKAQRPCDIEIVTQQTSGPVYNKLTLDISGTCTDKAGQTVPYSSVGLWYDNGKALDGGVTHLEYSINKFSKKVWGLTEDWDGITSVKAIGTAKLDSRGKVASLQAERRILDGEISVTIDLKLTDSKIDLVYLNHGDDDNAASLETR